MNKTVCTLIIPFLCAQISIAALPYFISASVQSTKIISDQKIEFNFNVLPMIVDTIKDSTMSCDSTHCVWEYVIKRLDTISLPTIGFNYSTNDIIKYIDTLSYSLFDGDNDSCIIVCAGADSIWGDKATRPGTEKRLYFSHASELNYLTAWIIQVESPTESVYNSIKIDSPTIFNTISNDSFYFSLKGRWKQIFRQSGGQGIFTLSDTGYLFTDSCLMEYRHDSIYAVYAYDMNLKAARNGWHQTIYDHWLPRFSGKNHLEVTVAGDTLIAEYTYMDLSVTKVLVRDTSKNDLFTINSIERHDKQDIKSSCLAIHPNPFNPLTIISFYLHYKSDVSLDLLSIQGRRISTILSKPLKPGRYELPFNAANLPSGIYIIRLKAENKVITSRAILIR